MKELVLKPNIMVVYLKQTSLFPSLIKKQNLLRFSRDPILIIRKTLRISANVTYLLVLNCSCNSIISPIKFMLGYAGSFREYLP